MNNCLITGKPCPEAPNEDDTCDCDWAQMDINNECGDYGTCRLTGISLLGEEEDG